jgi:hypothetical protein
MEGGGSDTVGRKLSRALILRPRCESVTRGFLLLTVVLRHLYPRLHCLLEFRVFLLYRCNSLIFWLPDQGSNLGPAD